jgi:type IV secretory pathway TrbD component
MTLFLVSRVGARHVHHSGAATGVAMLAGTIVTGDLSFVDHSWTAPTLPIVAKQRLLKQHALQTF